MPLPSVLGSVVPLDVTITDDAGTPIAPTTITCTITRPDDTTETPAHASPSVGVYTVDYVPSQVGQHYVTWTATGPNLALPDVFEVRPAVPYMIISLAEGKEACSTKDVSRHDSDLRDLITAVTLAIEDHLGEVVIRRQVTEDILCEWDDQVVLGHTPVQELISVTALDSSDSWAVDELHCDKNSGVVTRVSGYGPMYGLLRWVYRVGPAAIPANYVEAAKIIVKHLWETRRPTQRIPGPGGMQDSMTTTYAGSFGYAIPNRALELLGKGQPRGG